MPEPEPSTEPTDAEILAQQLEHLDSEGDRVGDPLAGIVAKP